MSRSRSANVPRQFSPDLYLDHLMGLSVLMSWRARWLSLKAPCGLVGPMLVLGSLPSQRFALGFPRQPRYGRHPFLAIQAEEEMFFRRIRWSAAWVDPGALRLVLVTEKVLGDMTSLEDIPAMGLSIWVDHPAKLQALAAAGRLQARGLWFDEEGAHVASGKPMASLRLRVLEEGQSPFPPGACAQDRSLADLVADRLARTRGDYLPYQGGQPAVAGEFRSLVEPFHPDQVPKVKAD